MFHHNHCSFLFLDGHQIRAYQWQKKQAQDLATFSLDQDSLSQWKTWCHNTRPAIWTLVISREEEQFQQESFPRLRSKDRHMLLQRRCQKTFATTPFCTYLIQVPASRRQQGSVLFAAVPECVPLSKPLHN